jgi:archaellum component FlaC
MFNMVNDDDEDSANDGNVDDVNTDDCRPIGVVDTLKLNNGSSYEHSRNLATPQSKYQQRDIVSLFNHFNMRLDNIISNNIRENDTENVKENCGDAKHTLNNNLKRVVEVVSRQQKTQTQTQTNELLNYCDELNSNISNAIAIYEQELLKVVKINTRMDYLEHKYKKTSDWVENIRKEITSFQQFVTKYFKPSAPLLYSDLSERVEQIQINLNMCEDFINKYVDDTIEDNRHIYTTAKECVESLQKVFSITKYNKYACPICIYKEVSTFVVPCGHTYCVSCSKKMDSSCFMCRQPIIKINSIFFDR